RAMGDVHPQGNPHYWLDADNGRRIAKAIQAKLSELDGGNAAVYAQREADFERRIADAEQRWKTTMAPYKGLKVVTYHRSWPNFADEFGLDVMGYVEPKPGIPPSPSHSLELIQEMKKDNVKIIIVELSLAQIAAFGATVAILLPWSDGDPHSPSVYWVALVFTFIGAAMFATIRSRRARIPQEAIIGISYAVASAATILALSKS